MKKILITMPSMLIGGAERSLLGLLESIDYKEYEVDLMLYRHEGEFMNFIPKEVNILNEIDEYTTFDRPIKDLLFSKLFVYGIARLISKLRLKLKKENESVWKQLQYISNTITPILPEIKGEYDLAICFLGISDVVAKKVNAKTKIAWIHTDYSILDPDKKMDLALFDKLDYIVTVSDKCKEEFLKIYPTMKKKSIVIENILTKSFIEKQSNLINKAEDMKIEKDEITFLSVGRYSEAKNFDNVPIICKYLVDMGFNIKWYIVGYGSDENLIKEKIKEVNMEDRVILLGKKTNPYPYIKKCDFYIQPSRYEGKAVTVTEAQILGKPVMITNYATAISQVNHDFDGYITELSIEGIAYGIEKLYKNEELRQKLSSNCNNTDYSNDYELHKLYDLF